ncbi:MAG: DNA endonuclease SmrA [Halioglobus sp.]|nr:DNA endonuclease SmrA [Halioglobus sp.]
MNSDGDDVFSEAMSDVVRHNSEPRVELGRKRLARKDPALEHRRRAAALAPERDRNALTETGITPLDAWYVLSFQRPGVQNGVFRKLKQGRYEAQSRLDLHRMTAQIARKEIFEFIEESYSYGLRSVLIIHGKGESKAEQARSSILKGCVDQWLRDLEPVLAFHSAQPRDGGTGAAYVLLRKSEDKKRENREKFAKGRVPFDPD